MGLRRIYKNFKKNWLEKHFISFENTRKMEDDTIHLTIGDLGDQFLLASAAEEY